MAKGGTVDGEAYGWLNGLAGVKQFGPAKSYLTAEMCDAQAFEAPGSRPSQDTIKGSRPPHKEGSASQNQCCGYDPPQ